MSSSSIGPWLGLLEHFAPDETRNVALGVVEGGAHAEMICRGDNGGGQMRQETAPRGGELVHLTDILLTLVLTDREQEARRGDLGLQQDGTEPLHVHLAQSKLRVDEAQMNGLEIVEAAQAG